MLTAAERLASTPDFSWLEKREGQEKVSAVPCFFCLQLLNKQQSKHCMKTPMLASSKPSRWPGIGIFCQEWDET